MPERLEPQDTLPTEQAQATQTTTLTERRGRLRNNFLLSNSIAMLMQDNPVDWIQASVAGTIDMHYINLDALAKSDRFKDISTQAVFWDLLALQLDERSSKTAEHFMTYAKNMLLQNNDILSRHAAAQLKEIWRELFNESLHNCQAVDRYLNVCKRNKIPLASITIEDKIEPLLLTTLGPKRGRREHFKQRRQALLIHLFPESHLSELLHED